MNVFRITTNRTTQSGRTVFVNFATELTLEQLQEQLNTGKLVGGVQLFIKFSHDDEGKCLKIVDQRAVTISGSGVAMIETPTERFVRFDQGAEA